METSRSKSLCSGFENDPLLKKCNVYIISKVEQGYLPSSQKKIPQKCNNVIDPSKRVLHSLSKDKIVEKGYPIVCVKEILRGEEIFVQKTPIPKRNCLRQI